MDKKVIEVVERIEEKKEGQREHVESAWLIKKSVNKEKIIGEKKKE
ncbi:aldo/keto reductase, partial [Klebsiella pneumoniae]|nr:aldo/keto reductase [Klebsiella pneumoniae]